MPTGPHEAKEALGHPRVAQSGSLLARLVLLVRFSAHLFGSMPRGMNEAEINSRMVKMPHVNKPSLRSLIEFAVTQESI